jgi:uncharacterized membrane protein YphA (DoxX/SURF4 family)
LLIGWHFLYEGISKMLIPGWSSAAYLENSGWVLSGFFYWIASNPVALGVADFIIMWGLTIVGLCLFLGFLTRPASVLGIFLLGLFYLANPPLIVTSFGIPVEGHYLVVNKNLVELFALLAVAVFPSGQLLGLDRLISLSAKKESCKEETRPDVVPARQANSGFVLRRELLRNLAAVPFLGAFAYGAVRKYNWEKVNAISGATIKVSSTMLHDLKGELPQGEIGGRKISRLIMGGNLIGGWSHARDLIYVSSLFKAYNTEAKIFETLRLAEEAGINTINIHVSQFPIISKYKTIFGSQLQTICQVHPRAEDVFGDIDQAIDSGVDFVQIQGNCCDWRVQTGEIEVLVKAIDHIRDQHYPAGLGAHSIQALIACEEAGIHPDFYMKTFHHDRYWSAHPAENRIPFSVDGERSADHSHFHDNMFCLFPEETTEFMMNRETPFIAFKILAGGAIHPRDGFKFAFENGADFICVGMFDYQLVDDVNLALDTLADLSQRKRNWCA